MGRISPSGYEYIAKKVAEAVQNLAEMQDTTMITIDEVAGELRTTSFKVVKAWNMFGSRYPHILYSPEDRCFFLRRGKSFAKATVGRPVPSPLDEEEASIREEALLVELESLGVDVERIKKEAEENYMQIIRGDDRNMEEKRIEKEAEEKKEEKGEKSVWDMSAEEIREMERKKFEENYNKIMENLARRGSLEASELAMIAEIPSDSLIRLWRERGGNSLVEVKDNRFIPNLYSAFSIVNKAVEVLLVRKLVSVKDLANIIHVREETLRDAWELVGPLIKYVKLEEDVFKLVKGGDEDGEGRS